MQYLDFMTQCYNTLDIDSYRAIWVPHFGPNITYVRCNLLAIHTKVDNLDLLADLRSGTTAKYEALKEVSMNLHNDFQFMFSDLQDKLQAGTTHSTILASIQRELQSNHVIAVKIFHKLRDFEDAANITSYTTRINPSTYTCTHYTPTPVMDAIFREGLVAFRR
jgi:hypothetical protein